MPHTIAPDVDRLPWLTDDHVRRPRRRNHFVTSFLAASAVAVIAALSYWLGMSGLPGQRQQAAAPEARVEVSAIQSTPREVAQPVPDMPQVKPAPAPEVTLPVQREVRIEAPPVRRVTPKSVSVHRSHPATKLAPARKASPPRKGLNYTNPWESAGASGRMVRVGAYSSLDAGKKAWSRLAAVSPAIRQLPAVVTDLPSRSGRVYYWLQIGTTSQAHSEVLCQRMRAIRQSCVVVDLAGARKGSGDERQPVGI